MHVCQLDCSSHGMVCVCVCSHKRAHVYVACVCVCVSKYLRIALCQQFIFTRHKVSQVVIPVFVVVVVIRICQKRNTE